MDCFQNVQINQRYAQNLDHFDSFTAKVIFQKKIAYSDKDGREYRNIYIIAKDVKREEGH